MDSAPAPLGKLSPDAFARLSDGRNGLRKILVSPDA